MGRGSTLFTRGRKKLRGAWINQRSEMGVRFIMRIRDDLGAQRREGRTVGTHPRPCRWNPVFEECHDTLSCQVSRYLTFICFAFSSEADPSPFSDGSGRVHLDSVTRIRED